MLRLPWGQRAPGERRASAGGRGGDHCREPGGSGSGEEALAACVRPRETAFFLGGWRGNRPAGPSRAGAHRGTAGRAHVAGCGWAGSGAVGRSPAGRRDRLAVSAPGWLSPLTSPPSLSPGSSGLQTPGLLQGPCQEEAPRRRPAAQRQSP